MAVHYWSVVYFLLLQLVIPTLKSLHAATRHARHVRAIVNSHFKTVRVLFSRCLLLFLSSLLFAVLGSSTFTHNCVTAWFSRRYTSNFRFFFRRKFVPPHFRTVSENSTVVSFFVRFELGSLTCTNSRPHFLQILDGRRRRRRCGPTGTDYGCGHRRSRRPGCRRW